MRQIYLIDASLIDEYRCVTKFCNKVASPLLLRHVPQNQLGCTGRNFIADLCHTLCRTSAVFQQSPFLGIDFVKDKSFEYGMIGLAFLIGVIALSHGYRRHHHKLLPVYLFTAGFVFLIVKEWVTDYEIPFLITAVVLILLAHYVNYRQCRNHGQCPKDDCKH